MERKRHFLSQNITLKWGRDHKLCARSFLQWTAVFLCREDVQEQSGKQLSQQKDRSVCW